MALTIRATDLWLMAIRQRNRTTVQRLCIGIVACLIFAPLLGWQVCLAWTLAYLSVQEIERQLWLPVVKSGEAAAHPLRIVAGHMALSLNASLFGLIALAAWIEIGPMGGVAASILLTAGMINSVINSAGSLRMFVCTVVPQWLILTTTPYFMTRYGAAPDVTIAATVAIMAYGIFCLTTRQNLFQARRAEYRARAKAERKQAEAEQAMADRGAFLTSVAHDLRTPISAILTGASKIEEADSLASQRQHAALISDAGMMMRDLLNDLLDHARLEAGRMTIDSHDFDARQLISQTVRLWNAPIKAKGLKLRLEGTHSLPRYLRGDPMRLRQILNNLISNALKFTEIGHITLRVCAWLDEQGRAVLLMDVEDTGQGMTPAQMSRLFLPFDQTTDGVAARFGGSGLGLTISRHLIELMNGRLTVRSEPGQGATFTLSITLPLGSAPPQTAKMVPDATPKSASPLPTAYTPIEAENAEDTAPIRVLVVDDHAINRRAIQLILQAYDCEISMAENGLDALSLCQTQAFDLIFMDVRMPELDGRETTRRLRASGGVNAQIPVIAVTADNAVEDRAACKAAGMSQFVAKPLTPHALLSAMQEALYPEAEEDADQTTAEPEATAA